ncbi:MAG: SRPBCC family protein [Chitinophagaceae bacterium]|nr:SRPBCC family protein [Chitinophagaceae bacterium]
MRAIKLAALSLVILFIIITGISLFIPSNIRISRAINIKADKEAVMSAIRDPTRWKTWHPGMENAPLLYVNGKPGGVILDSTSMERPVTIIITKETPDQVTAEFNPKKLRPVTNVWQALSYSSNDSITIQWYMHFNLRWYPWEKFSSLLLEKSHGTRMEEGLGRLKKLFK